MSAGTPDPDAVRRRREDRRRFLERLYRSSEEEGVVYEDGYEVAEELGLSRTDAERIARYHEDHGHVKGMGGAGLTLRITAAGIDFIESSSSSSEAS
jgi:CTP-dependent riboflavin kinase